RVIVSDVRTEEELRALKCIGTDIILVVRNEFPQAIIQETRISLESLIGNHVFWNYYDNLEDMRSGFHILYEKLYYNELF
ncbi:MAG: hypothetical protein ACYSR0_12965, partial [Planctomycetota bacterium]